MKKLKTVDLIAINEYAKALKQSKFIIIGDMMIGLNYIDTYVSYIDNIVLSDDYTNMIFIKRELSAFVKTISHELEFEIYPNNTINSSTSIMNILYADRILLTHICGATNIASSNRYTPLLVGKDITNDLENLFSMKKADGMFKYIYENDNKKYFMTLYPGLLPVNKNDKVYINIIREDIINNIFTTKFTVIKNKAKGKSIVVTIIMSFINLV